MSFAASDTPSRRTGRWFRARVLPALGLALCAGALVACTSGSPTGTTAATPTSSAAATTSTAAATAAATSGSYPADKAELCQARDQLKTSITALTSPALLTGGTDGITTALTQVQTDLQGVLAAGKQDSQAQIDALQSSLTNVQTAVGQLADGGGAQNLVAVGSAISATGTASAALFNELITACGS